MRRIDLKQFGFILTLTAAVFFFGVYANTGCNGQIIVSDQYTTMPTDSAEPETDITDIDEEVDSDLPPPSKNPDDPNDDSILPDNEDMVFFNVRDEGDLDRNPTAFASADFSEDGILDLAVVYYLRNRISVYLGGGEDIYFRLIFSTASDSARAAPQDIITADFNGDAHIDLAVTNNNGDSISILLGRGDGIFSYADSSPIETPRGPASIVSADFDANGIADLVVTLAGTWLEPNNAALMLLGNGDASFVSRLIPTPELSPWGVVAGDFNSDEQVDFVVTNRGDRWSGNTITVFLANDGEFLPSPSILVGANPISIVGADFNEDDIIDFAVANFGNQDGTAISLLLGNGDGNFESAGELNAEHGPDSLAVSDFDGNGTIDLASSNFGPRASGNTLSVFLNNENASFSEPLLITTGAGPVDLLAADFDNDGDIDFSSISVMEAKIYFIENRSE